MSNHSTAPTRKCSARRASICGVHNWHTADYCSQGIEMNLPLACPAAKEFKADELYTTSKNLQSSFSTTWLCTSRNFVAALQEYLELLQSTIMMLIEFIQSIMIMMTSSVTSK
ncbi:hypothetical protein KCV07_g255, partial [Aureobasidium melanogenum]